MGPEVGKLYRHAFLDAPLRLVVGVEAVEQEGSLLVLTGALLVKKGELLVETVAGGRRYRVIFTPRRVGRHLPRGGMIPEVGKLYHYIGDREWADIGRDEVITVLECRPWDGHDPAIQCGCTRVDYLCRGKIAWGIYGTEHGYTPWCDMWMEAT